ncbi:MAG TPA: class I SAM-dependent methyltransferase [Gemmata sp.]
MIPDWQLPPGVDRGLWDYLHAADMVATYDDQIQASPLAGADVAYCERNFAAPGRLLDLGCGTGRLCLHFAQKGFECVGVDLSEEMLARAREKSLALASAPRQERERGSATFVNANLVDLSALPEGSFDFAACLFSTLGMVRGAENRARVLANALRLLKPGGTFVLHAHNRFFRGLGLGRACGQFVRTLFARPTAGDLAMPQAYGGAPLTLHHFTHREAVAALRGAGFRPRDSLALTAAGAPAGWPRTVRAYGWLLLAERPA